MNTRSILKKKNTIGIVSLFDRLYQVSYEFEEAIRNLVEMNGGNVLLYENDAYNLKTLDHLLKYEITEEIFGPARALYGLSKQCLVKGIIKQYYLILFD